MTDWRKAVELADGWYITHINDGEDIVATDEEAGRHPSAYFVLQSIPQWAKDAIAAQLVRQMDATDKYRVCVQRDCVTVCSYTDGYPTEHGGAIGRDNRTENTVNAILDSGVLEPYKPATLRGKL